MEAEEKQKLFMQLDKIERGIYGDTQNKAEGLLDKVTRHEKMLKPIEFFYNRPKLTIGLMLTGFEMILEANKVGLLSALISLFKQI